LADTLSIDAEHSDDEGRSVTMGFSHRQRLLVVHTAYRNGSSA
jgi:hypothetical protein